MTATKTKKLCRKKKQIVVLYFAFKEKKEEVFITFKRHIAVGISR
jgi:hypothetical protein